MQEDIRTLLTNSQWKQGEGFLIPAYLALLSALDVSSAVYLTHEEVFEKKYTREEFKKDLSQLTIEDCIILTSKILTVLENDGRLNLAAQKGIAQHFRLLKNPLAKLIRKIEWMCVCSEVKVNE